MPTNWVITEQTILQESGGNIFTENGFAIALEEFDSTVWTEQDSTGSG
jgi:hypothetical protein